MKNGLTDTCEAVFRDSVGIRTQDPQLRRLLLYPTELPNQPNVLRLQRYKLFFVFHSLGEIFDQKYKANTRGGKNEGLGDVLCRPGGEGDSGYLEVLPRPDFDQRADHETGEYADGDVVEVFQQPG